MHPLRYRSFISVDVNLFGMQHIHTHLLGTDDVLWRALGDVAEVHAPLGGLYAVHECQVLVRAVGVLGGHVGHAPDGLHTLARVLDAQPHVHVLQLEEVDVQGGVEQVRQQVAAEEVRGPVAEGRVPVPTQHNTTHYTTR